MLTLIIILLPKQLVKVSQHKSMAMDSIYVKNIIQLLNLNGKITIMDKILDNNNLL